MACLCDVTEWISYLRKEEKQKGRCEPLWDIFSIKQKLLNFLRQKIGTVVGCSYLLFLWGRFLFEEWDDSVQFNFKRLSWLLKESPQSLSTQKLTCGFPQHSEQARLLKEWQDQVQWMAALPPNHPDIAIFSVLTGTPLQSLWMACACLAITEFCGRAGPDSLPEQVAVFWNLSISSHPAGLGWPHPAGEEGLLLLVSQLAS